MAQGEVVIETFDSKVLRGNPLGDPTRRLLDAFDATGNRATFFVLGWIAERQPALAREIVQRGHEIACHGHQHEHQ